MRYANLRLPQSYMSAKAGGWADTSETIDRETAIAEFLMLGLRLLDGVAELEFRATFGCGFREVLPELEVLASRGLIAEGDGKIRLTRQGLMLGDSVISRLASHID